MAATSPLVGRRAEIDQLVTMLTGGGAALVVGEAGVGKSRVVTEVAAHLARQGHRVVAAACLPLSSPLPLLPIVDLLKALTQSGADSLSEAVLASCHAYVRDELARLVPGLVPVSTSEAPAASGWQQQRLFGAVVDFLRRYAQPGDLTMIIEDLHWSDPTTQDFLSYLFGHEVPGLSALLTARDHGRAAAATPDWLRGLELSGTVMSQHLAPLSRSETGELARAEAGALLPDVVLDQLFRRTQGNPFYVKQLLAAGRSEPAGRLPGELGMLLRARAANLDAPARRVLNLLAVAGRELNDRELVRATGDQLPLVRAALRELLDGQLVRVGDGGAFVVTHALLGEAVAEALLPGEQAELGLVVAQILLARSDRRLSGEAADHLERAGRRDQELPARVAAAEYAESTYAFAAAARQWRRATTLAEASGDGDNRVAELALRTILAIDYAGDLAGGEEWAHRGLKAAQEHGQRHLEAALWTRLGLIHTVTERERGRADYRRAIDLFETLPPSPEFVQVLHLLYRSYETDGQHQAEVRHLLRALKIGELGGFDRELVPALISLAWQQSNAGELEQGIATLTRARNLADALNDPYPISWVALAETDGRVQLNLLPEAADIGREQLERLHSLGFGDSWISGAVIYNTVDALLELGRVDEASVVLEQVTHLGAPMRWPVEEAWSRVELARAEFAAAEARMVTILEFTDERGTEKESCLTQHRAELALWQQQPETALELVRSVLGLLRGTDDERLAGPLLVLGMRACSDVRERGRRPEGALANPSPDALVVELERLHLDPFEPHPYYVIGAAAGLTWSAELTRARGRSDPEVWDDAATAWHSLGRPHRTAYARWRQAEALLAAGDRPRAATSLQSAWALAEEHQPLRDAISVLARMARVDLHNRADRTEPAAVARAASPYGLTDRELEVLRLVADGLTNSQIGSRLYMSPKTASVHVTAILRKLGATNRVHAAAMAERAGLVRPSVG